MAKLVKGPLLRMTDFKNYSEIGPEAIGRRFGGWGFALERAGLAHMSAGTHEHFVMRRRKYSDEKILEEIRRVTKLVDKPGITSGDFSRCSGITLCTIRRRFGSWPEAVRRAGLTYVRYVSPKGTAGRRSTPTNSCWTKCGEWPSLLAIRISRGGTSIGVHVSTRAHFVVGSEVGSAHWSARDSSTCGPNQDAGPTRTKTCWTKFDE